MTEALDHYKEGLSLFGQQKHTEAISAYEKALEARPGWTEAMHGLAMACMHSGDIDRAIEVGQKAADADPEDPFAFTSLSMFYQRKSQIAEEAGDAEGTKDWIAKAEKEQGTARLLSWKIELRTNPNAPPPETPGPMDVIQ